LSTVGAITFGQNTKGHSVVFFSLNTSSPFLSILPLPYRTSKIIGFLQETSLASETIVTIIVESCRDSFLFCYLILAIMPMLESHFAASPTTVTAYIRPRQNGP
jgi:hypothetical protein